MTGDADEDRIREIERLLAERGKRFRLRPEDWGWTASTWRAQRGTSQATAEHWNRPTRLAAAERAYSAARTELADLIAMLTDEGMVNRLDLFVLHFGKNFCTRVIEDNFAVVHHVPFEKHFHQALVRPLGEGRFLPTDEALRLAGEIVPNAPDYWFSAAPWAPIGPEDEPDLISRYAAAEPKAVAEVRQRNAKRREAWLRRSSQP